MIQEAHTLRLTERKSLQVTGVTEVARFEETQVVLQTQLGMLTVLGEDLKLRELSVEGGHVAVEGSISALIMEGNPIISAAGAPAHAAGQALPPAGI